MLPQFARDTKLRPPPGPPDGGASPSPEATAGPLTPCEKRTRPLSRRYTAFTHTHRATHRARPRQCGAALDSGRGATVCNPLTPQRPPAPAANAGGLCDTSFCVRTTRSGSGMRYLSVRALVCAPTAGVCLARWPSVLLKTSDRRRRARRFGSNRNRSKIRGCLTLLALSLTGHAPWRLQPGEADERLEQRPATAPKASTLAS